MLQATTFVGPATLRRLKLIAAPLDLDCGRGSWLGKDTGESWCKYRSSVMSSSEAVLSDDSVISWQQMLSFDPLAGLTVDQHKLVMGGQVSLWSEQADETNLETLLWPRALAAVEVFWSGSKKGNLDNALPRLHDARYRMKVRPVTTASLPSFDLLTGAWHQCRPFATRMVCFTARRL